MEQAKTLDDQVLKELTREAVAEPETVGLLLSGSRATGHATAESDYDLYWVLTDDAHERRRLAGEPLRERRLDRGRPPIDLVFTCQRELDRLPSAPGWWTYGYATARVLIDKTGDITPALRAIATMPPDKARADVAGWFDAYVNALSRSMRAWRRGDELGARLQAADSAMHLVRTLFALEGRWTPYFDRLEHELETLAGQGWPSGYLRRALLDLVGTGAPDRQIEVAGTVEALLRARGFGDAVDAWAGDELTRIRAARPR